MQDDEAYQKYPQHRKWFNKLWLAEKFGYHCGPAGVDIVNDGTYIIRPIYNLSGMGAGAKVCKLEAGDKNSTPPGHFWCEYFDGKHYSANYRWKTDYLTGGSWEPVSCWEGKNFPIDVSKFIEWKRSEYIPELGREFKELSDVKDINVEFINDSPIEVHLRHSPDPDYDWFIPIWKSNPDMKEHYEMHGFEYIEDFDDADGHLDDPRLGFMVK